MRLHELLGTALIAILLTVSALAAEPEQKVDKALDVPRQYSPDEALSRGRELRQLAGKGDAQAAFDFAVLLTRFGRFGPLADASTVEEWSKLANGHSAFDWIMLAAEAGNQPAIGTVCRFAEDPLAPAHVREKSMARCAQLQQRYPPK